MPEVGVEAVVKGLMGFTKDMGELDKSIGSLLPTGNLLTRAFTGIGNVVEWLTGSVFRVLEYTLGNLLSSAIQGAVRWVQELAGGVLESADTFQKLEIRLQRLNFNDATASGLDYNKAMEEAIRLTKEQLDWTIRLGAKTPFDAKDVANIFTLAKGYGFSNDEAKGLTESVIDFTAGMGLTNTELERVIVNFGQLRQQGKLNNQDLRDLARGAFVPINKIIAITAEKLGMTVDEFNKLKSTGKLTADAVDIFRQSFQELVGTDFAGASEALGNVFTVARQNVEGLIRDTLGMYVIAPILMTIGTHIQSLSNTITDNDDRWKSLVDSLNRIGTTASNIVSRILGLGGGAEETADKFLGAVEGIATWLETNQDKIVGWIADIKTWIEEKAIPAIIALKEKLFGTEDQPGAIQKFGNWLMDDFMPYVRREVLPFLSDLNDMIFGGGEATGPTLSPDKQGGQFTDDMATEASEIDNTALQNMLQIFTDLSLVLPPLLGLLSSIGQVIVIAFGGDESKTFGEFIKETLIPALIELKTWVDDNKVEIAAWIETIFKLYLAFEAIGFILGVLGKVIAIVFTVGATLVAFFKTAALIVSAVYTAFNWLSALLMTSVSTAFAVAIAIIVGIIIQFKIFQFAITNMIGAVKILADSVKTWFNLIKANVVKTITDAVDAVRNGDWIGAGKAILDGMYRGIIINTHLIITTLTNLARNALDSAKKVLGIRSPSTEFFEIGEQLMQGFANGITATADLAAKAMQGAANQTMTIGAMAPSRLAGAMAPGQVSNMTTNNLTLNMHSSAQTEPILQDFEMMQSLVS